MQPLLLVSYGAPERREDVVPFLKNLFTGKNVPAGRIEAAAQKYEQLSIKSGHYSPLNSECRKLIDEIKRIQHELPVYWGNLYWHPLLVDTVAKMTKDGVQRALCFATSAFDSPSGNQCYTDALESARKAAGTHAPILEKLPLPFDHPLFIEAQTDRLLEALACHLLNYLDGNHLTGTPTPYILFSAHSIPIEDAARSRYVEQLQASCQSVIEKSGTSISWELVYQSRSGPACHWLGPDIRERISELAMNGVGSVIVSPLGFFCENRETEYDLDVEVGEHCEQLGLSFFRAKAVGAMPKICRIILALAQR